MVILKDRIIGLILILMFTVGCAGSSVKYVENSSGLKLKGKINLEKKTEHWNEFNGNGYRLMVYKVDSIYLNQISMDAKALNFIDYDISEGVNPFGDLLVDTILNMGNGSYKITWNDNEITIIVVDQKNMKIICYYNYL